MQSLLDDETDVVNNKSDEKFTNPVAQINVIPDILINNKNVSNSSIRDMNNASRELNFDDLINSDEKISNNDDVKTEENPPSLNDSVNSNVKSQFDLSDVKLRKKSKPVVSDIELFDENDLAKQRISDTYDELFEKIIEDENIDLDTPDPLKVIETQNFKDTVDVIKSYLTVPKVSTVTTNKNLSKYFPQNAPAKQEKKPLKSNKSIKEVDLSKYFGVKKPIPIKNKQNSKEDFKSSTPPLVASEKDMNGFEEDVFLSHKDESDDKPSTTIIKSAILPDISKVETVIIPPKKDFDKSDDVALGIEKIKLNSTESTNMSPVAPRKPLRKKSSIDNPKYLSTPEINNSVPPDDFIPVKPNRLKRSLQSVKNKLKNEAPQVPPQRPQRAKSLLQLPQDDNVKSGAKHKTLDNKKSVALNDNKNSDCVIQ